MRRGIQYPDMGTNRIISFFFLRDSEDILTANPGSSQPRVTLAPRLRLSTELDKEITKVHVIECQDVLFAETVAAVVNSCGLLWRHALRPLENCAVIMVVGRIGPTTNIPRMIEVMDACFSTHYTTLLTDRQKENASRLAGGTAKSCENHEKKTLEAELFSWIRSGNLPCAQSRLG